MELVRDMLAVSARELTGVQNRGKIVTGKRVSWLEAAVRDAIRNCDVNSFFVCLISPDCEAID